MDFTRLTPEELNMMDKQLCITIIDSLQGRLNAISSHLNFLTEQVALMNQRSLRYKSETLDSMHQMTLDDAKLAGLFPGGYKGLPCEVQANAHICFVIIP